MFFVDKHLDVKFVVSTGLRSCAHVQFYRVPAMFLPIIPALILICTYRSFFFGLGFDE